MLLHDSVANCCHLQGATIVKDIHTMLYRMSNLNGEIFIRISVTYI